MSLVAFVIERRDLQTHDEHQKCFSNIFIKKLNIKMISLSVPLLNCDPAEMQKLVSYTTEVFLYLCGTETPLTTAYLLVFFGMSYLKLNWFRYQP